MNPLLYLLLSLFAASHVSAIMLVLDEDFSDYSDGERLVTPQQDSPAVINVNNLTARTWYSGGNISNGLGRSQYVLGEGENIFLEARTTGGSEDPASSAGKSRPVWFLISAADFDSGEIYSFNFDVLTMTQNPDDTQYQGTKLEVAIYDIDKGANDADNFVELDFHAGKTTSLNDSGLGLTAVNNNGTSDQASVTELEFITYQQSTVGAQSFDFTAGDNDLLVMFNLVVEYGANVGIDNVSMVPEPSAYAFVTSLFGLVLAMLRRRK